MRIKLAWLGTVTIAHQSVGVVAPQQGTADHADRADLSLESDHSDHPDVLWPKKTVSQSKRLRTCSTLTSMINREEERMINREEERVKKMINRKEERMINREEERKEKRMINRSIDGGS